MYSQQTCSSMRICLGSGITTYHVRANVTGQNGDSNTRQARMFEHCLHVVFKAWLRDKKIMTLVCKKKKKSLKYSNVA